MRKKRKNTLDKRISCCMCVCVCVLFQCQQPRGGRWGRRDGDEMRERDRGRATLTRGGPHAGRPELPQDEALLALGQRQEELVGFYALLTATEAQALSWGQAADAASSPLAVPASSSPALAPHSVSEANTLDRAQAYPAMLCLCLLTLNRDPEKYEKQCMWERQGGCPLVIYQKGKLI